ncbi:MAG: hypothetical protein A3I88_01895 [Candidatus Portnoybacteria bacterium RIFCSPLOWO2_12_FULL_39_9]|uniref:Uncharacterized protein n=1 Tax=Candidatus Portnoybacteria bacterium RIFCSPHIGHO2_12_FULL_38_9 TaxID=1801997 RepID=A0A1G2FIW3_9BACT|nr:MAG: hypothetical protein A3H00_01175 [Candidatus Portnoybacteria bacterium RBG_13_40_8]OGZ36567.1 MAG: hypothetical protein A2646_00075 [Candidatus Portnoybacteria bacterium RIFCSPHIGHO2_02_FULL_39_12]OGZ37461.1 MAG: hypothetical protein A3J64_00500 [Candidatus Portnoybacteria bacterium RIFCSPHIGHO2_12_FULL_38_9]OGZ39107.1 MAG: hypothetical protein A3F21_00075 [Candidatus Portnoybacteria bacterium RIFCSPLOWO2_01_FULL_38_39]OGZ40197.1 MAG: hypothetical protein A3I88_01895 [Candidatus Portnoy
MPDYSGQLTQVRQQEGVKKASLRIKLPALIAHRMKKAVADKESWAWPFAFILALFNDGVDLLGLGAIPILGDFLDIFCGIILTMFLWDIGWTIKWKIRIAIWLAAGLEIILGLAILPELIPFWLLSVWYAHHQVNKKAEIAERGLKKYRAGKIDREAAAEFS